MIERMNIIDDRGINMDQYWVMENETLNPIWPRNDVTRSPYSHVFPLSTHNRENKMIVFSEKKTYS